MATQAPHRTCMICQKQIEFEAVPKNRPSYMPPVFGPTDWRPKPHTCDPAAVEAWKQSLAKPPAAPEEKMVFAVSKRGDEPLLLLGIPASAWDHMKDGKTHHFDLTKAGIPLKLMVFGGSSRSEIQQIIEEHNRKQGISTLYQPGKDFGIDGAS